VRVGRVLATGLVAALATGAAVAGVGPRTASAAPTVALVLTPIDAAAGWFRAQGECPTKTTRVRFDWNGAPNRTGFANVDQGPGPFDLLVRLLAATPGGVITVKASCNAKNGGARRRLIPVTAASGNSLLPVPAHVGSGRRIVYQVAAQQMWVIESDEVVTRTFLVSGRRLALDRRVPQAGTYQVASKDKVACDAPYRCTHMVRYHRSATGWIGFHAIPTIRGSLAQGAATLGQPRSHGCPRLAIDDARWMFEWTKVGDTVIVLD
jgi:hypothetical protein